MKLLNLGSGQRRFDAPWINADVTVRHPDQVPDVQCNGAWLPFPDSTFDGVALVHVLEHFNLGAANNLLYECHRVLKQRGSLYCFTPDLKKLAVKWITGKITDYIFLVNTYGAWQGDEADIHRWNFTQESLCEYLKKWEWSSILDVRGRDWRGLMSFCDDWWMTGVECVK